MAYAIGTLQDATIFATAQSSIDSPNFTAVSGDHLVAVVGYFQDPAVSISCLDTVGGNDTWVEMGTGSHAGFYDIAFRAFLLTNATGGSCTVRASFLTNTVDYPCIVIIPITGLHPSAFDQIVWGRQNVPGSGTDATTSTNTGTLANQPACLLGYGWSSSEGRPNAGTGFTSVGTVVTYTGDANPRVRIEHKRVTVTTAVAATFTAPVGADWHITGGIVLREFVAVTPTMGRRIYILP